MQDIREVLRTKERQLEELQKEIEALRFSIDILEKEEQNPPKMGLRSVEPVLLKSGASLKQFP